MQAKLILIMRLLRSSTCTRVCGSIVYISGEDEVKFDDFCRLLKESLSLGATLPDFSDGSTGSELRENFELAAFRCLYTQHRGQHRDSGLDDY